tara:strand:- start:377 stop:577 length:201 start_codon:yes stop_codon:yes gene_type:complete
MNKWLEAVIAIREVGNLLVPLLTVLDRVEHEAGKPLDQMGDEELLALLSKKTRDSQEIFDKGRESV